MGPFAAVLQCLQPDPPLLKQQNKNKLYGIKNNCMPTQLGQILDPNDTETKTQLPLLQSLEQKHSVRSKKRILSMSLVHTTTKGVGKIPKQPLRPEPWTLPYLHSIKGTSLPLSSGSGAREPVAFLAAPCYSRDPN